MKEKEKNFAEALEAEIAAGEVKSRGLVANHWNRKKSDEDDRSYRALRSDRERRAFKLQWAERQLEQLTVAKTATRRWSRVDATHGAYLCMEAIAEKYGYSVNPSRALKTAKTIALKCARMGGSWMMYDSMAEDYKFLHLEHKYKEEMSDAWELYENWFSSRKTLQGESAEVVEKTKALSKTIVVSKI